MAWFTMLGSGAPFGENLGVDGATTNAAVCSSAFFYAWWPVIAS